MDFNYEVTIKGSSETIELKIDEDNKNQTITGVKFGFNSDDATRERDRNGRIEIILYGKFDGTPQSSTAIRQMSDWAKSKDDIYREVTIKLSTADNSASEGNFTRTYHFDKMFCIDYFESTGSAIENGQGVGLEFYLFMAQAPTYKISETQMNRKID